MRKLLLPFLAAIAVVAPSTAPAAAPAERHRTAILVGATAPVPGRALLRHAHRDAQAMADVLVSVGGFDRASVHVLKDPDPAALVARVAREAAALAGRPNAMLFFYYSGHADQGSLYSDGRPVSIEALRAALDRSDVSLRIGVLDACQGGGWTRAKGLVPEAPFEVKVPALLSSEGSALIASSSGSEYAHESDALGGSYFTHHFVAALRGAGDESGDGEVTLTEGFEYARDQTVRETARRASEPQHPSFAVNLKGRQDVVLAQVSTSPSTLALEQASGPIEVLHLKSGLRILELAPGRRLAVVAVPPGEYLVRKVGPAGVESREVTVPSSGSVTVSETELVFVGAERLAVKGERGRPAGRAWPTRGHGEAGIGLETWRDGSLDYLTFGTGNDVGVGGLVRLDGRLGITDRLAWKIGTLALAYRLGSTEGAEFVPYGGLLSWKLRSRQDRDPNLGGFYRGDWEMRLGGGIGARLHFPPGALVLTIGAERITIGAETGSRYMGGLGVTVGIGEVATIHLALGLRKQYLPGIVVVSGTSEWLTIAGYGGNGALEMWLGSLQEFGLESLPLVRFHLPRRLSLDLYASGSEYHRVSYGIGVTREL